MAFDFSQPAGEPSLALPGGVSWRIFANPVALFIGGVAAVLLALAEPSVRSGVRDHRNVERDPGLRLRRTGFAAMMTVYGRRSAAEKLIERVVRMHGHVEGSTPEGVAYHANDPRLLDWVQATAVFGFSEGALAAAVARTRLALRRSDPGAHAGARGSAAAAGRYAGRAGRAARQDLTRK
ncbi:oxygenase MpaB family protein [Massilia sp. TWR1-2-2]|uniref:oxygenase MpaB family protein n=1 Tax=Massilia sp. TWR1-2-2 TaxID=2804584 RepID=UPI003CF60DE4